MNEMSWKHLKTSHAFDSTQIVMQYVHNYHLVMSYLHTLIPALSISADDLTL